MDSLKCNDLARDTWYSIEVNQMCGTYSGKDQALLELVEKRPGTSNQRATIFKDEIDRLLYLNKGKPEFQLFKQQAGEKGAIEALAVLSADGQKIEKVKLHIVPNGGDECSKEVNVASVWDTVWN